MEVKTSVDVGGVGGLFVEAFEQQGAETVASYSTEYLLHTGLGLAVLRFASSRQRLSAL